MPARRKGVQVVGPTADKKGAVELELGIGDDWNELQGRAVRVPPWFSCAQARAVLQLKGCAFVVISSAPGVYRVASREQLAAAPPDQAVSGVAVRIGAAPSGRRSDRRRESDRRAGAGALTAPVRIEDARHVADEHLAERRQRQPASFEIEAHQALALEAA